MLDAVENPRTTFIPNNPEHKDDQGLDPSGSWRWSIRGEGVKQENDAALGGPLIRMQITFVHPIGNPCPN